MKKLLCIIFAAMASQLFCGCSNNGSSAAPPTDFAAVAGDGRVVLTWTAIPEVDYWIFTATDPSLTAFVWASLPDSHVYPSALSPFYMCGLFDGTEYWFASNGRKGGGPGGSSSATVSATPYQTGTTWSANAPLTYDLLSPDLYGVGYASLKTCSNITTSAAGAFAAVGAGGTIFTSVDGTNWDSQGAPAGFSTDLYAVTGYANNPNSIDHPLLRWVAVGDGGASVYSTDGITWAVGRAYDSGNPALRSLTHIAGAYLAAGDAGTILSSTDGITWTARTSGTTSNLNGVTHGGIYVAVGDSGTILTSIDSIIWTDQTSGTASTLRQASSIGNTYVAVGDAGTIVTSVDTGTTWTAQAISGAPNLVGIAANAQLATINSSGLLFSTTDIATNSLFVAVDSSGNAYTSTDGITWSAPIATGATSLNSLVSSGFGYVAAGNSGATVTSF